MIDAHALTFFHSPNSRSVGVMLLLEELGASYDLRVVNFKAGEQRSPEYMAINPMGKVPAIRYRDELVTEQVAIFIFLADLFPDAGLAPALDDPLRGPFLRWIAFYGSCFEPAVVDRALKRDPAPPAMCPYGDFDTMLKTVTDQLGRGAYLLGDRMSAADILWVTALNWMIAFKLVPVTPVIETYVARVNGRESVARVRARDAELAAKLT